MVGRSSYLIQRLKKPWGDPGVFTFGGGYRYGGLSKEAFEMLNKIFSFDYMGSAEFEFGAVQVTLKNIADSMIKDEAAIGSFNINKVPVYYICYKSDESDVKTRIKDLASGKYFKDGNRTKESVFLDEVIAARNPDKEAFIKKHPVSGFLYKTADDVEERRTFYLEYMGWIDLDNNFIFFVDKTAFVRFVKLIIPDYNEIEEPTVENKNRFANIDIV
jgi:hypothetical protein